uniref:Zinc finger protein 706 n=14 Tax=Euacanthomorphacea TaxID=123369 RepID=A0A3Q1GN30_9TELE
MNNQRCIKPSSPHASVLDHCTGTLLSAHRTQQATSRLIQFAVWTLFVLYARYPPLTDRMPHASRHTPSACCRNFASITSPKKPGLLMARGHQKIQSQQKNAKKQAEMKKAKGHDQKTAAKAALVFTCAVCRSQMPDPKTFKQHFESKHPKSPLPPELEGVEA